MEYAADGDKSRWNKKAENRATGANIHCFFCIELSLVHTSKSIDSLQVHSASASAFLHLQCALKYSLSTTLSVLQHSELSALNG